MAASTVLTNLVRIGSTVILTRLLAPDVYGLTGLILSVFYVINLLSDVGFQAYLVRHHRSDEPDFLNAIWTIHAARGVALATIGIILAWPVSMLLAKPELAAPLAVASLTFAIDGQASLHQYRALREGRVPRFALLNLTISVSQTFSAIALAVFFRNIWAIVGSMIVASLVRVWLSYVMFPGHRHSIRRDREVAVDLWRFARLIAASSALTLIITQADKLAMSRILPLSQFGTYVIASSLAAAPTVFAFNYASTIVYPAVAQAWREGSSYAAAYYRCWGRFFYLYALGGGGLFGASDLIIRLLYDPRYLQAERYLAILAVSTTLSMVTRSMENLLVGIERTRATVEFNLIRVVWLAAGGILALVRKDAILFVLTIGLTECPAYVFALWRMQRLHLVRWGREASLGLTIAAGFGLGTAASVLGQVLFPNL